MIRPQCGLNTLGSCHTAALQREYIGGGLTNRRPQKWVREIAYRCE